MSQLSRDEKRNYLELDRIIFIGRTYEEYVMMFRLDSWDLQNKKILDCPAGACSFTARANELGIDVTACDIAYTHPSNDLKKKGLEDISYAMNGLSKAKHKYIWEYFRDVEHLKENRIEALTECVEDMKTNNNRYVPTNLPSLPFCDKTFDVTLSAHFLFMYSDRLDFTFHLNTIKELMRVTKEEIRIFPLVDLEGKRYTYLDEVIEFLTEAGSVVAEVKSEYEFHANAHSMLVIKV